MIIIHAMDILPRAVDSILRDHMQVMPAVVVTGSRQTGKSTMVERLFPQRRYYTLDDLDIRDMARRDPELLVGGDAPITLDEVQRVPDLLLAVKRAIDRDRRPGRFLLTGSANLLLMNRVSESLAGRASYLVLRPMTLREQRGEGRGGPWGELVAVPEADWMAFLSTPPADPGDWRSAALRGGYPTPALELETGAQRAIWFDGYVQSYLERDLQDLSSIDNLTDFRRLMRGACLRLGTMVNQSELGRDVGLPQATVHRWLGLMETSYMLHRLPAYSVNRTRRLIKTPKLYWSDTGLALHMAGEAEPSGAHLENLILNDLKVWADSDRSVTEVAYWRTTSGEEVDLVVEVGDRLLPIEVKATTRPRLGDTNHLQTFRKEYGGKSLPGLLLHAGDRLEWLAPGLLAVPWWRVV
jgi:uncharacterized protein